MSRYTRLEKIFHTIILGSKAIQEISFYAEKFFKADKSKGFSKNPVFVMGLARSGTMYLLHQRTTPPIGQYLKQNTQQHAQWQSGRR